MANYVAPVSGTWAAKGSSPFQAARDGGHRYHAGNDLQAANGSPAVAAIGGTVQYVGHNQGYQWNAVVMGDDGNAYRYATHGPLSVKAGERVEAGQQVGTIARGHLHFEVIPPTSPAYKAMAANPGAFVSTSWKPGHDPLTVNPAEFFGVKGGAEIAAGQAVGTGAPQDAQSAIASLIAPSGGTQVAEPPTAAMGFAPTIPDAGFGAPPMQMASAPPMPQPPPQWAQNGAFPMVGAASTDAMVGGPMPPTPRLRDQSVLEQQRADQLDAALFGAGPHRGEFARARPSDVFQINPVSGAPDAASVPGPNASPLRPAIGGPNDRRPQPPMPNMRPEGRYVAGAGGAPDAGSVPTPNPRGTPYAPSFPALYGEQPAPPTPYAPMVAGRPEFPGALPAASRSGDLSAAMGGPPAPPPPPDAGPRVPAYTGLTPPLMDRLRQSQGIGPFPSRMEVPGALPAAPNPYDDWTRQYDIPGPFTLAAENAPPPAAAPYAPMVAGRPEFPGAIQPPRPMDFTAASEPAPALTLNDPYANQRRPSSFETAQQNFQMPEGWTPGEDSPPPPAMFNPPYNQAAEWFKGNTPGYTDTAFNSAPLPPPPTQMPSAPQGTPSTWGKGLPVPSFMSQDQFNVSFAPGGPGVIADLSAPSQPEPATAAQGNPFDALLGPGAAMAAIPFNDVSQGIGSPDFGNARAASVWDSMPPSDLGLGPQNIMQPPAPPSPALMSGASAFYRPDAPDPTFAGGSVVRPPTPVPGQPGVVQGTMPGAMDIRPPAQGGPPLPPQALPQASPTPAPRQTNVGAERQRNGTLGRILGGLLGGPVGALGGGLLGGGGGGIFGGGGGFGFGGQPTYAWSGGGTTPGGVGYRTGTSNAVGGSNATSWQNSKGNGTVTVVQDPWTGTYYGPSYGP